MTTVRQDFAMTAGDDEIITFCVVGPGDVPLDISAVSNIEWSAYFDANNRLLKTLDDGDIEIVDGPQGRFAITLAGADTAPWTGLFPHQAVLIDDTGKRATIADGTMTLLPRVVPL